MNDDRTALELVRIARRELGHIEEQLKWRSAELDGIRVSETTGKTPGPSDPTVGQTLSRTFVSAKINRARQRLVTLVDSTLPSIYGVLRLEDERRREADDNAERSVLGGISAYRGDRKPPAGRPDLHEALDAQRRRIDRGDGYGVA